MIILFQQKLISFVLASQGEQLPLVLTGLLSSLVVVLHHLLLQELFLRQTFPLCLFMLALFELALLLRFEGLPCSFFSFSLGAQSSLLIFIFFQHARLLADSGSIRRGCGRGSCRRRSLRSCREIWGVAGIEEVGWFLTFNKH
jgi:hypothetical protein